jgi:hemolysin III
VSELADRRYSFAEEIANSLTHAFGLVLAIAGLIVLLIETRGAGVRAMVSCALYGITLVLVYATSVLYHAATGETSRRWLRTLDHVAIFLLIAGTYTPFVLIALRGAWGWSLFGIVWTLAAIGTVFELTGLRRLRGVMIALYIGMGWVGIVAIRPLMAALPMPGIVLVFAGGVSYTLGVVFYVWRSLRYHHAVWHLFVVGGSVLQFLSVLWYVLPKAT